MPLVEDHNPGPRWTAEAQQHVVTPPPSKGALAAEAAILVVLLACAVAIAYGLYRARHAARRAAVTLAAIVLRGWRTTASAARAAASDVRAKADRRS